MGNWTLEDIKGSLVDDMKAMMQEELRQVLTGLMPLSASTTAIPPVIANPPIMDAPPDNHDNTGG